MIDKDKLTEQIIGCCFAVHRELGPGFPEKVYHSAVALALQKAGIAFENEKRYRVSFQDKVVGEFQADLVVEQRVIVEIKAISGPMPKVFTAQVIAYLKAAALPVGLLVNFGGISCQVRRLAL